MRIDLKINYNKCEYIVINEREQTLVKDLEILCKIAKDPLLNHVGVTFRN